MLEFGSGLGHLAWGMYKLGAHVTATDTPMGDLKALRGRVAGWLKEDPGSRLTSDEQGAAMSGGADGDASAPSRQDTEVVSGVDDVEGGSIRVVELT